MGTLRFAQNRDCASRSKDSHAAVREQKTENREQRFSDQRMGAARTTRKQK